jgi:hypothetical protein
MATRPLGRPGFDSWQGQEIFYSAERPHRLWPPASLVFNWYQGYSRGTTIGAFSAPSADVKNEWSYASISPLGLRCVDEENVAVPRT